MNKELIQEKIADIIKNEMGFTSNADFYSAHFINDFGMNSLDIVELTVLTERVFKIYIDDESALEIRKVNELVNFVHLKID